MEIVEDEGISSDTPIKRVTITNVAEKANVSIKTVSRVMHREPNVKDATRKKVEAVAKELGYRMTSGARSSSGVKSYLIGFLYDNPNTNYIADLLTGSIEKARSEGYHLVIEPCNNSYDPKFSKELEMFIVQSNLAGLILTPPLCDEITVLKTVKKLKIPYVRIAPSTPSKDGLSVSMDDFLAAYKMTGMLIDSGHQNIAFITGRKGTSTTEKRYSGFLERMQKEGLDIPSTHVLTGDYTYKTGLECAEQLLSLTNRPTAIFASNDDMAAAVISIAKKYSIDVPSELSVVGFDDSEVARIVWPALTTVRQPIREMAEYAIEMLINTSLRPQRKTDSQKSHRDMEFEIVMRDSVMRPRRS